MCTDFEARFWRTSKSRTRQGEYPAKNRCWIALPPPLYNSKNGCPGRDLAYRGEALKSTDGDIVRQKCEMICNRHGHQRNEWPGRDRDEPKSAAKRAIRE